MSSDVPPVFERRAFAKSDGHGNSCAEWTLTPASLTDPVQLVAEPIETLPIIYVPGIMGSNLMLTRDVKRKKKGDAVWLVDTMAGAAWSWARAGAATRQLWLNPATTAVFDGGAVPDEVPSIGDAAAIRKERHWGEVSAASYGEFLEWLQRTMNHAGRVGKWRAGLGRPDFANHIATGMAFKPMTEADVSHAAYFRYPVYACGYNWLQSNLVSADTLARRIKQVIEANNSVSYTCKKVILVTHSMGGLVARACSELTGMRDRIAGIVHGVMPAHGAAVAYKRVRSGTEGAAGLVLGDTAEKMTAVFANSPGALQLLPNKEYGSGWLRLGMAWKGNYRQIVGLPKADPYEEIYKQRGPWWALVREELINPGDVDGHGGWTDYIKNIDKAAKFHAQLSDKYHPNSYSFHGDGKDFGNGLTWDAVGWFASMGNSTFDPGAAELLALRPVSDDGVGQVAAVGRDFRHHFYMAPRDSAGDGTVPVRSGNAPAWAGSKATYHLDLFGEGHEGAYRVGMAQRVTVHAILQIAQTVSVLQ